MTYLYFLLTSLGGSFIQSISGFGFGIFVMSFFPLLFPVGICATLSGLLSMVTSTYLAIKMRKKCSYKRLAFVIIGYIIFSMPAILLSSVSPNEILKKALGVVLIILSIYFMFFESKIKIKESKTAGFIAGGLGGILSGFFAMGGPPVIAYLLQTSKDSESYLAEAQTYLAAANIFAAIVRLANGMINLSVVKYWVVGVAAVLLGTFLGRRVSKYIGGKLLKRLVYGFMAISGVTMLF